MKKTLMGLHILLLFYSVGGYFSKSAAGAVFLSKEYILDYFAVLGILMVYAVFWQLILKKLPLTVAMANKSITVIWGMLYGVMFFQEKITFYNLLGAGMIILGICLVSMAEPEKREKECI